MIHLFKRNGLLFSFFISEAQPKPTSQAINCPFTSAEFISISRRKGYTDMIKKKKTKKKKRL